MGSLERRSLRLRIALFFGFLGVISALGTIVAIFWLNARLEPGAIDHLVVILGGLGAGLVALIVWTALKFDEHVARPIMAVAADLRTLAHADTNTADLRDDVKYLGMLGPAATDISKALIAERRRTEAKINEATAEAAHQKEELESLLRDLRQGLVVCTMTGRVTLYNHRAAEVLHVEEFGETTPGATDIVVGTLGLGRDFFNIVDPAPFERALAAFARTNDNASPLPLDLFEPLPIVFSTRDGARTMRGTISPRLNANGNAAAGFVLVFDDVTAELAEGLDRDRMLRDVSGDLKQALESGDRSVMATAIDTAVKNLDSTSKNIIAAAWPMTDLCTRQLFTTVKNLAASEGATVTLEGEHQRVHGDSATLTTLLLLIIRNLAEAEVRESTISVAATGRTRDIILAFENTRFDRQWLTQALQANADETTAFLSGNEILERHRAEIEIDTRGIAIHFAVNTAAKVAPTKINALSSVDARPEFYDFNLFERQFKRDLLDVELDKVHFVVFDCEMTGLDPARDALCSIAGARVVNERVLKGEMFDTYVNPGRPIPPSSTKVHHITDAMVADAPDVGKAVRRFHNYASGQVLVAHNAAFDMAFLSKAKKASGVRFDNVVLDTVLLGAHLFGDHESLTLDTLAKRFDVVIPPEARHTAIGDAVATADVMIGMIQMLKAEGIVTLRDALKVSEQQTAIRKKQKEYA
ncbi:MAG: 3'-5' exonuclease [Pseudomonadota bacterium]